MKKNKNFTRLNLYLDFDLADTIKTCAQRDYLRPTTWVTQYLRKSLLSKDNLSPNANNSDRLKTDTSPNTCGNNDN